MPKVSAVAAAMAAFPTFTRPGRVSAIVLRDAPPDEPVEAGHLDLRRRPARSRRTRRTSAAPSRLQQRGVDRAHHRVGGPVLPRRDPHLAGEAQGGVDDERVVAVRDGGAAALARFAGVGCLEFLAELAPEDGDPPGLVGAVQLVPADVEQRDGAGPDGPGHLRQPDLVDLERGGPVQRPAGQRVDHARRHVRAAGVAGDRPLHAERGGEHAGRGRLAVGPADAGGGAAGGDGRQHVGIDLQRDLAADHLAGAAAEPARGTGGGALGDQGQPGRRSGRRGGTALIARLACQRSTG